MNKIIIGASLVTVLSLTSVGVVVGVNMSKSGNLNTSTTTNENTLEGENNNIPSNENQDSTNESNESEIDGNDNKNNEDTSENGDTSLNDDLKSDDDKEKIDEENNNESSSGTIEDSEEKDNQKEEPIEDSDNQESKEDDQNDESSTSESKEEITPEESSKDDSSKEEKPSDESSNDDESQEETSNEESSKTDENNQEEKQKLSFSSINISETTRDTNNTNFKYGAYYIKYSTDIETDEDSVKVSCSYLNDNEVAKDILTIDISEDTKIVTIGINSVFTSQIKVVLSSNNNQEVKANTTIDFEDQVSVTSIYSDKEGTPLKFQTKIESTGGSILHPITLKDEKVVFNEYFISKIKANLSIQYAEYVNKISDENCYIVTKQKETYYGLDNSNITYWQNHDFTFEEFYNSFYVSCYYAYDDEDSLENTPEYATVTFHLKEIVNKQSYAYLFDGTTNIFEYTFTLNDVTKTRYIKMDENDLASHEYLVDLEGII